MNKVTPKNIFYVLVIILTIYLATLLKQCAEPKETTPTTVETPAKTGGFDKPTKVIPGTPRKDSVVYRKGKTIYTENPINKQLAEDYLKATDSIKRLKLYLDAIQEKDGTYVYDNNDLKLEVYTKTRGEILEIKPKYTIKPTKVKIDVPVKQTVFAMYGGIEVFNNATFNNIGLKADLGIQNKKGNMFTIGVDTKNNYYVGTKVRFLDIKK